MTEPVRALHKLLRFGGHVRSYIAATQAKPGR